KVPTCTKNFKFVLMILVLAGLVATGVTLSNASADKEKLDVGADVSVKGEIGKSGVEENTTASANVSASSSSSEKSEAESHGDYSAQIQLPPDAKNGAYTVDVKGDVSADLLSTLSLKTQTSLESSAKFVVVSPNAFAIKAGGKDFSVQVETNSSDVSDIKFDEQGKKLSFTVQGETGTKGVTEITIPKSLLSGDL